MTGYLGPGFLNASPQLHYLPLALALALAHWHLHLYLSEVKVKLSFFFFFTFIEHLGIHLTTACFTYR